MSEHSFDTGNVDAEYLAPDESVETTAAMDGRLFVVTDRRVLDIVQGTTSSGREYETVESTLFTDVANAEIDAEGRTDKYSTLLLVVGIGSILLGLLAALLGLGSDAVEAVLVGVVLLGLGVWILLNAERETPGGVRIHLKFPTEDGYVYDSYTLPDTEVDTAHAVLRAVGEPHTP